MKKTDDDYTKHVAAHIAAHRALRKKPRRESVADLKARINELMAENNALSNRIVDAEEERSAERAEIYRRVGILALTMQGAALSIAADRADE